MSATRSAKSFGEELSAEERSWTVARRGIVRTRTHFSHYVDDNKASYQNIPEFDLACKSFILNKLSFLRRGVTKK
jgi:hypothetical protein